MRFIRAHLSHQLVLCLALAVGACRVPPSQPDPQQALIDKGREIFFNETFAGNGRTCGSCHPADNNFTIDPAFIAGLPNDDPLFVAELNPDLAENFENPTLMREFGLILENLDGFDDLANIFVMRGVPHTLALRTSIDSSQGPRTGWSGDGSPGDGSLRSFAIGAVIQHFTKTLNRIPGLDFRLPTDAELDALEAFQASLGRQQDLQLPLPLKGTTARRGQQIFLDNSLGKCNICHRNAGANATLGGQDVGNANFDTGVEEQVDQPIDQVGETVPPDDGLGTPGDGTFNTPPLIEAADTGPFFHNNSIETMEGAVAFYNSDAFNNSPSGQVLASLDPNGVGIRLEATQVVAVAAFLRVFNALENIRQSVELLQSAKHLGFIGRKQAKQNLQRASLEIADGILVLEGAGLHPPAVKHLTTARRQTKKAARSIIRRSKLISDALEALEQARGNLIETV